MALWCKTGVSSATPQVTGRAARRDTIMTRTARPRQATSPSQPPPPTPAPSQSNTNCNIHLGTGGIGRKAGRGQLLSSSAGLHRLPLVPAGHVQGVATNHKPGALDFDELVRIALQGRIQVTLQGMTRNMGRCTTSLGHGLACACVPGQAAHKISASALVKAARRMTSLADRRWA